MPLVQPLKICVFGAGAIGGVIAGQLARAGLCEVSLVARGEALDVMRDKGLTVELPDETFTVPVNVTDDPAELGVQDYVLLTLKAHQMDQALDGIATLIGPDTAVLPPTTGLPHYFFTGASLENSPGVPLIDPTGRQAKLMPAKNVLGIVYWIGAHTVAPGTVAQDGAKAGCPIGELDGSLSPRVTRLAEILTESGIPSKVNANVRGAIWVKFVNSLCWNPLGILTLARNGQIAEHCGDILQKMMEEADAAARVLGVEVPQPPGKRIALTASGASHKMSMLQDLEKGKPLELDILEESIGEVRRLSGLEMPTLEMVLEMARLRAMQMSTNTSAGH
ncbi:MAG: 2-dehydropantoate 2-reductase [Rhodobiaceae bacterium]|nr:2-dehydropantoate 2-reductase [Rhodobiaceae bacterium]